MSTLAALAAFPAAPPRPFAPDSRPPAPPFALVVPVDAPVIDGLGQVSTSGIRSRGTTFEQSSDLDSRDYAAHGGVFPLIVKGVGPVGTVGVSGLPQVQDHEFVVQQLELFLATP